MVSAIKSLVALNEADMNRSTAEKFSRSYGAMTMVMGYLPRLEQLHLQQLS